ncbi:unnamed protein product [Nesidiocoris tenuis]|uniref:C2H2-type domain-containing protein n=1 Tax=Nesidiocoris tenuis TaxID=355587 RepID=A0A6H5HAV0_9HEMI|nr:unnamed protein product [Nesidiocoris tenuis]
MVQYNQFVILIWWLARPIHADDWCSPKLSCFIDNRLVGNTMCIYPDRFNSSNCKNLTNVQSDSRRQSIVSNVNSARLAFSAGRVPGWPSASNMRRSVFKINKTLGIRGGYDKFYELLLSRRRTSADGLELPWTAPPRPFFGDNAGAYMPRVHGRLPLVVLGPRRLSIHGCPTCGREYRYKRNLVYHIRHECGQKPKHKCPHCDHVTKHKGSLKKHISSNRFGDLKKVRRLHLLRFIAGLKYKCKLCGKHYSHRQSLFRHKKFQCASALALARLTCNKCGKVFRHYQNLWTHRKYVCGLAPKFSCHLCPYKAKLKVCLKQHYMNKHRDAMNLPKFFLNAVSSSPPVQSSTDQRTYKDVEKKRFNQRRFSSLKLFWRTLIFNTDDEVTIVPASSKTSIVGTRLDEEEASFSIHRLTGEGGVKSHDVPEILEAVVTGSKSGGDQQDESSNALSKEEALALLQSLRIVRVSPKKPDVESHWAPSDDVVEQELSYGDPMPSGSGENASDSSKIDLDEPREEGAFVVRDGKVLNVCHICSYESTVTSNFKRHLLVKHGLVENVKLFPKRKKPRYRKGKGDADDGDNADDGDGKKSRIAKPKRSGEKAKKQEISFDAERPAVFRVKRTLKPFKKFDL